MPNDFTYCISHACPERQNCLRFLDEDTADMRRKPLATYYKVMQRDKCPMFIDIVRPVAPRQQENKNEKVRNF
jgi:hypothetical protein